MNAPGDNQTHTPGHGSSGFSPDPAYRTLVAELELLQALHLLTKTLTHATSPASVHDILAQDAAVPLQASLALVCQRTATGHWTALTGPGGAQLNQRADAVQDILNFVAQHSTTLPHVCDGPPHRLCLPLSIPQDSSRPQTVLFLEATTPWTARRIELASTVAHYALLTLQHCPDQPAEMALTQQLRQPSVLKSGFNIRNRRVQLVGGLLLLALLPLELKIPASGLLEPVQRQRLYAAESGLVTELTVNDGATVVPGDVLVRLRSDELELQQAELLGALAEAQARLAALESTAARGSIGTAALTVESEQAELRARILSLEQQRSVLQRRLDSLVLRATAAGTVVGRDLQQRFVGRPLLRGQWLLDVVPADSPWQLQLDVAETDLRHVLQAFAGDPAASRHVTVSYFTETTPERQLQTTLASIASAAELSPRGELQTRLTTTAAPATSGERPGVGVQASVHCGRRPLLYILLRRAFDFVRRTALLQGVY